MNDQVRVAATPFNIDWEAIDDDRFGIVGKTGSGKTYGAGILVEKIIAESGRVIIPDPLGVWWGLRLQADGRRSSTWPIVIFGGAHGDIGITPEAGAIIGETIATMKESAIIDLSQFPTAASERRFMLAMLGALYRKASGQPVHVIFDEADLWAPERILDKEGDATKLHAMLQTIVRRGRVKGFSSWLITQRPAALSKSVLSQVDNLIAFRLTSSNDRKALGAWIEGQADTATGKAFLDGLAEKPIGEAVVWMPARGVLASMRFPRKVTYDSSRTPKRGEQAEKVELKPLDLGELREKLASVEEDAKASDPGKLRAEIARLRAEAARAIKPVAEQSGEAFKRVVDSATQRGYQDGYSIGNTHGFNHGVQACHSLLYGLAMNVVSATGELARAFEKMPTAPTPAPPPKFLLKAAPPLRAAPAVSRRETENNGELSGVQQRILDATAEMQDLSGGEWPPRTLVAVMAGYKHVRSKGFTNALSSLSAAGAVRYPSSGTVEVTESGRALANPPKTPATAEAVQERVIAIMGNVAGRILRPLIEAYPEGLDRQTVANAAGYEHVRSKSFTNNLSRLSSAGFVRYEGGLVVATRVLFP